jgi:hypothetical protein
MTILVVAAADAALVLTIGVQHTDLEPSRPIARISDALARATTRNPSRGPMAARRRILAVPS